MRRAIISVLLLVGFLIASHAWADTNVSGTIGANTTWTLAASPYIVTGDVSVGSVSLPKPVLTIEAGVTIKFNAGRKLSIGWGGGGNGELQAVGTATQPITFTANTGTPSAGYWSGIWFSDPGASSSQLTYATVSYAGVTGNWGGIRIDTSSPTIRNTTVQNCAHSGITILNTSNPFIADTTLTSNPTGLSISYPGSASLQNFTIANSSGYAISADARTTLGTISGLTATGNGTNGIELRPNTVDLNTTWKNTGLPYVMTYGDVTVGRVSLPKPVLTIEAGVTVKFNAGRKLAIGWIGANGELQAVGTATQPITFTANTGTPSAGYWTGIHFFDTGASSSQLTYATVSYGGVTGNWGGIRIDTSSPTIRNTTVQSNAYAGVSVQGTSSPVLQNLSVQNNADAGIRLLGTTNNPTIVNCSFSGNVAGIVNGAPTNIVIARLNYWNNATGPSGSGPGTGQSVSTGVKFEPWLIANPSQPQFFTAFTQNNRTFNPAIGINTNMTTSTAESGDWMVTITNSSSTVVRTITGTGITANIVWDGKNDTGSDQPDGTYTYELASTSSGGTATHARGPTVLDRTRQLAITGLAVDQAFFSPNGDAIQDTAKLTGANLFDDTSWTVNVRNSTGTIVRTNASTGLSLSFTWDGRNGSGAMQPDGLYTLETIASNGTASVTGSPTTTLDNTLPAVSITNPASGQILSNVYQNGATNIDVNGSVGDANLTTWVLEQGTGAAPISWNGLASGYSPMSNATLYTWITLPLTNSLYSLRLRAWDRAGNWGVTQITSTVGNFKVSQSAVQINAGAGNTVTYTSAIPFALTQTLVMKNAAGQIVRALVNGISRAAGSYPDAWNGRSDGSTLLPDGPYFYVATVTDGPHTLIWDLTSQYSNDFTNVNDGLSIQLFDPFNNRPMTFSYNFSQPGQVSIGLTPNANGQVPSNCNAPNFCLAFNKYEESGPHTVTWAGVDDTGVYRPDVRKIGVVTQRYAFSKNAVVLFGTKPAVTNVTVTPAVFGPARGTQTVAFDLATYQNQTVSVVVSFLNQASRSVLRTISLPNEPVGHQTAVWDGRADNGALLSPGFYTVTVTATDAIGNQTKGQILTTIEY
jgi:parallel beta-helix repeat protein